jgi:hypothetical protein
MSLTTSQTVDIIGLQELEKDAANSSPIEGQSTLAQRSDRPLPIAVRSGAQKRW